MRFKIIFVTLTLFVLLPQLVLAEQAIITEVVSANVIKLDDGRNIKLFGVEPQRPAKLKKFLENNVVGQAAELEFEDNKIDDQGNILGYVFLTDPEAMSGYPPSAGFVERYGQLVTFLNVFLVAEGFSDYKDDPILSKYNELFGIALIEAKANRMGIWAKKNPETQKK